MSDNPFLLFADAMGSIGAPIYSDEHCGRLLAYACLSNSEDCVMNSSLNMAIAAAQGYFNIRGGEIPDMDKMQRYWKPAMLDLRDNGASAEWFPRFAERYSIDKRRFPLLARTFREWCDAYYGHWFTAEDKAGEVAPLTDAVTGARLRMPPDDEPTVATLLRDPTTGARLREPID